MARFDIEDAYNNAVFRFIILPVLFLLGLYVVSVIITQFVGANELFRWIIFSGGLLAALVYYFKKQLSDLS
ncbi:MAG: hypothetical protein AABW73_00470 [Nanoarchaeota archaeon]